MAKVRVARGSRANLPSAFDANTLLYGELYWEREESSVSKGVLYVGKPDGVADGTNDKEPLPIGGSRAMQSLYVRGTWDPSGGAYPSDAEIGDVFIADDDGTGFTSAIKFGDWAVCVGKTGSGTLQWVKVINQSTDVQEPLLRTRDPQQLNNTEISLQYDSDNLIVNGSGQLAVENVIKTNETSLQGTSGPVQVGGDLTVDGNFTVQGNATQLDLTQVNIVDNFIQVNSNQTGTPPSLLKGGVEVNRGDETNYRFVFAEDTQTFRVGTINDTQPVATRLDNMGVDSNVPVWDAANNRFKNTTVTIAGSTVTGDLNGNATTASQLAGVVTLSFTGDVTGSIAFDGSVSTVTEPLTVQDNSHSHVSANISDATGISTPNTVVKRDASGNFAANTITADLTGRADIATTSDQIRGVNFRTGNTPSTGTTRLNMDGALYATQFRTEALSSVATFITVPTSTVISPGRVYVFDGTNYVFSSTLGPNGLIGIHTDVYGTAVGFESTAAAQLVIATAGFILAYVDATYPPGEPLTGGPGGELVGGLTTAQIRDNSWKVIATYWKPEPLTTWNGLAVNGRHWVKVR